METAPKLLCHTVDLGSIVVVQVPSVPFVEFLADAQVYQRPPISFEVLQRGPPVAPEARPTEELLPRAMLPALPLAVAPLPMAMLSTLLALALSPIATDFPRLAKAAFPKATPPASRAWALVPMETALLTLLRLSPLPALVPMAISPSERAAA